MRICAYSRCHGSKKIYQVFFPYSLLSTGKVVGGNTVEVIEGEGGGGEGGERRL